MALTRAQSALWVFGHAPTLMNDAVWRRLVETAQDQGMYAPWVPPPDREGEDQVQEQEQKQEEEGRRLGADEVLAKLSLLSLNAETTQANT